VRTCEVEVLHYHTFKEFRSDLARFFEHYQGAGTERLLQGWADIDPSQRIVPKREFNALAQVATQAAALLRRRLEAAAYAVVGRTCCPAAVPVPGSKASPRDSFFLSPL
jgi:hypothetical protein